MIHSPTFFNFLSGQLLVGSGCPLYNVGEANAIAEQFLVILSIHRSRNQTRQKQTFPCNKISVFEKRYLIQTDCKLLLWKLIHDFIANLDSIIAYCVLHISTDTWPSCQRWESCWPLPAWWWTWPARELSLANSRSLPIWALLRCKLFSNDDYQ